jgi:hypothetical protein
MVYFFKTSFQTVEAYSPRLAETFLPEDCDFYTLQQCERRQQQKNETFELFLAKMNKLFDSRSYELPKKQKLMIPRIGLVSR